MIFGSVSFDWLPQVKKCFTFPFANVNLFVISSKTQDEDIFLVQNDLGKIFISLDNLEKSGFTNEKKLVTLFLITPLPATPLRGLLTTCMGKRLIPGLRRYDWILRALLFAVTSLWPHKVGSMGEIYSARWKLMLISDQAKDFLEGGSRMSPFQPLVYIRGLE